MELGKNIVYYEVLRGEFIFFLCLLPQKEILAQDLLVDSLVRLLMEKSSQNLIIP